MELSGESDTRVYQSSQDQTHTVVQSANLQTEILNMAKDIWKRSAAGFNIKWTSYGAIIIIIAIASLTFAFLLYSYLWIITNDTVNSMEKKIDPTIINNTIKSIDFNTFGILSKDIKFWFGYFLLAFPLGLYLLIFWAYTSMLYNARLAEIVRALNSNLIDKLLYLNTKDLEDIYYEINLKVRKLLVSRKWLLFKRTNETDLESKKEKQKRLIKKAILKQKVNVMT